VKAAVKEVAKTVMVMVITTPARQAHPQVVE
jgi:hypothetical protein